MKQTSRRTAKNNLNIKQLDDFLDESVYCSNEPSQASLHMINNIVNGSRISREIEKLRLKSIMVQIFNDFQLNEHELALWSIYIDKYILEDIETCFSTHQIDFEPYLRKLLIFTALLTKQILGNDSDSFLKKYLKTDKDLKENYDEWAFNRKWVEVNIKLINTRFSQLKKGRVSKLNYNYYVDDIVLAYCPYSSENKKRKTKNIDADSENKKRKTENLNEKIEKKSSSEDKIISGFSTVEDLENKIVVGNVFFFPPPIDYQDACNPNIYDDCTMEDFVQLSMFGNRSNEAKSKDESRIPAAPGTTSFSIDSISYFLYQPGFSFDEGIKRQSTNNFSKDSQSSLRFAC